MADGTDQHLDPSDSSDDEVLPLEPDESLIERKKANDQWMELPTTDDWQPGREV